MLFLSSLSLFFISFFKMSSIVRKKIVALQRNFFWGCEEGEKKIAWVSWENTCKAKKVGGGGMEAKKNKFIEEIRKSFYFQPLIRAFLCTSPYNLQLPWLQHMQDEDNARPYRKFMWETMEGVFVIIRQVRPWYEATNMCFFFSLTPKGLFALSTVDLSNLSMFGWMSSFKFLLCYRGSKINNFVQNTNKLYENASHNMGSKIPQTISHNHIGRNYTHINKQF